MIKKLGVSDLSAILEYEKAVFTPAMQASAHTYRHRFELGHHTLGYWKEGLLCGVMSFSYVQCSPDKPENLPKNFADWSSQPTPENPNGIFIYNLGMRELARNMGILRTLVHSALMQAKYDGCFHVIAEGPVPSYTGTPSVSPNPTIREALLAYKNGGSAPAERLLFRDPHLALYRRLCRCRVLSVIADFLPSDTSSGGFRVMLYRNVSDFFSRAADEHFLQAGREDYAQVQSGS